jgi:serine protease Do
VRFSSFQVRVRRVLILPSSLPNLKVMALRRVILYVALLGALLLLTVFNVRLAQRRHEPSMETAGLTTDTFAQVAHRALPKTVTITISGQRPGGDELSAEEFFGRFLPEGEEVPPELRELWRFHSQFEPEDLPSLDAAGSGVIVSEDGHIVTNQHLFLGLRDPEIEVQLYDGRIFRGDQIEMVASDRLTDLAVLRIDAEGLDPIEFGDSDRANIGDWVIAIGNPLHLAHTVTQGIISAKYRETSEGMIVDFLQTSAHIDPGSSGGALLNLEGEVIGINTAIATESQRWEGFGFALPSNTVRTVVEALIERGRVPRGYIGIYFPTRGNGLSEGDRRLLGYDGPGGVLVLSVVDNGPAQLAGLENGDIIVTIAGQPVSEGIDLLRTVAALDIGSVAEIEIWRGDRRVSEGSYLTVDLAIADRPPDGELRRREREQRLQDRASRPEPEEETLDLPEAGLHLEATSEGGMRRLVVTEVERGSSAETAGFEVGDVIVRANGLRVRGERDLIGALRLQPGDVINHWFLLDRGEERLHVTLGVEEAGLTRAPEIEPPPDGVSTD